MSRSVHIPRVVTRGGGPAPEPLVEQRTPFERAMDRARKRDAAEKPKTPSQAADPEFEKKHPRGQAGTSVGGKFVRKGDSGDAVRAVQRRVGATVDGKAGSQTEARVRAFQTAHGLTVDGVVGRQTAAALLGHGRKARSMTVGAMSDRQRHVLRARGRPPR